MARKKKTIDDITAKFSVKTLPTIKGGRNYEVVNKIMQLLYANTATLLKPQVGGHHSHTGIIMKTTLYITLLTTAWSNPPDPGVYPVILPNSTASYQYQLQFQHVKGQRIYKNTVTMDKALKNQFIESIEDTYLK